MPISSSAHLLLPAEILGWPDQGLAFDTAVHLGTLTAVAFYFRQDIAGLAAATSQHVFKGAASDDSRFAICLLIASLPILPVGFFGRFVIEANLRHVEIIIGTTIGFGLLLLAADRFRGKADHHAELTPGGALMIGIAQCLALIPGTSRSGVTMTAALFLGYTRETAARISLLISIPAIAGAATVKLWDLLHQPEAVDWMAISLGVLLSGLSAYACIALFLKMIERIGLVPFVVYRMLLGLLLILIIY